MSDPTVAEQLGGAKALEREVHSDLELADAIQEGLSYKVLEHVLESGMLAGSEAYGMVGSRRSLTRKVKERATLSPSESDRLARVVRLISRAEEALGDRERAQRCGRQDGGADPGAHRAGSLQLVRGGPPLGTHSTPASPI
jgi:uncharacterized protein (DUF2384 family)